MRIFLSLLTMLVTAALCFIFDTKQVLPAPLGKLLSPQHGVWQNAEPVHQDFSADISFPQLKNKVDVYFDERLVPHIFAEEENDAYFVQGYLHAKFRLWQMELQCFAAAGRASEIIGEKAIDHDKEFRRLGMVYAAENTLAEMEKNPAIKAECDAYTAGVNAYIETLTQSSLPLEYKLIGYFPEKWSNLKSALFLKYMSYDLAAHENDFEMTNARSYFKPDVFHKLFPAQPDSLDPIIPRGTHYATPSVDVHAPVNMDSINFSGEAVAMNQLSKPDRENGSNNWAVAGSKTKSGKPILCNDPHLGLNLPSLWYEMQIHTPQFNAYGVTFPGAPSIVIGYNDSCAWGVTNGGRDVRDYYEIQFRDDSHKEYFFNNNWEKTNFRIEKIKVAGKPDVMDTVAYTIFGPVMYDRNFGVKRNTTNKSFAVRWKAHDPSNELLTFNLLNRAKNYEDYLTAVMNMQTPGQNFAFASKSGDIAMRTQGFFPAKWKEQGDYLMNGTDSTFLWRGIIPQTEVPTQFNPERGFISSANQHPADSTYPYYLGRDYPTMRGFIINRMLTGMNNISPENMMQMQTSNYNVFAELAKPAFVKYFERQKFNSKEIQYWDILLQWNLSNDIDARGATIIDVIWKNLFESVYEDEYAKAPKPVAYPLQTTLLEAMLRDSSYIFTDDISTTAVETWNDMMVAAYKKSLPVLDSITRAGKLEWGKYKDTRVNHLTKLDAFSRLHLPIGGGSNIINATRDTHGPSWRMIVHLNNETEAYGVYPGGQSGNPGSRFYDQFIDQWAAGKYYKLWMMNTTEISSQHIIAKMQLHP